MGNLTLPRQGCRAVHVRTLFFAAYRDAVGLGELALELRDGCTVGELVGQLRTRGSPYDVLPADPAVAVNHVYAGGDRVLADGDEVALIPPVAGG